MYEQVEEHYERERELHCSALLSVLGRVSWELVRMRLIAGAWKVTHEVPLFLFPYGQFH